MAVSYLEVYGESLRDLLDGGGEGGGGAPLAVQEGGSGGGGVHVGGLREVPVSCSEAAAAAPILLLAWVAWLQDVCICA